jgi:large subunit ribosomal protein L23
MAFNLFSKDKDNKEEIKKPEEKSGEVVLGNSQGVHRVISNLYVSEKSSMLSQMNQYVFKVKDSANKSEIRKHIEALYKVKVKDVKVLNMPEKRRDLGKRPGVKSGYRKAIVILEKGQTIEQVTA